MSQQLTPQDLTGASVGSSGNVKFPLPGIVLDSQGRPVDSRVRIYNESGCEINVVFSNGSDDFIPAGAWPVFSVDSSVTGFTYTVTGIIPNAPISKLNTVYYFPNESVPSNMVLGNSPIGITGNVSTNTNTLSNEGNTVNTEVIDIGPSGLPKMIDIFNDHFIWSVVQSSVAHQVLKGNISGNPLQLGQSGDVTEVLGQLKADNSINLLTPSLTLNGATSGTFTVFELLIGTVHLAVCQYSNCQNNSASAQQLALAAPYSFKAAFVTTDVSPTEFYQGVSRSSTSIITALAAGGGTKTGANQASSWSIGGVTQTFDHIALQASDASGAHNGLMLLWGI